MQRGAIARSADCDAEMSARWRMTEQCNGCHDV
jgi:hypothetical protein